LLLLVNIEFSGGSGLFDDFSFHGYFPSTGVYLDIICKGHMIPVSTEAGSGAFQ
jgi:hypothetical protein